MTCSVSRGMGLCLTVLLGLFLAFNAVGGEKTPKMSNIQGRVKMIDKNSSTITVTKGTSDRAVVFSGDTKFLYGHSNDNKPGSLDQVKDGYYISCSGTFSGVKLNANECIYRKTK